MLKYTNNHANRFIRFKDIDSQTYFLAYPAYARLDVKCDQQATVVGRLLTIRPSSLSVVNNRPTTVACLFTLDVLWSNFLSQRFGIKFQGRSKFGDYLISTVSIETCLQKNNSISGAVTMKYW